MKQDLKRITTFAAVVSWNLFSACGSHSGETSDAGAALSLSAGSSTNGSGKDSESRRMVYTDPRGAALQSNHSRVWH
jgi:hypothetical protein